MNLFKKSLLLISVCAVMQGCSSENEENQISKNSNIINCNSKNGKDTCKTGEVIDLDKAKGKKHEDSGTIITKISTKESVEKSKKIKTENKEIKNFTTRNSKNAIKEKVITKNKKIDQDVVDFLRDEMFNNLSVVVKRGDTFLSILNEYNISNKFFYNLNSKQKKVLVSIKEGDIIDFNINHTNNTVKEVRKKVDTITHALITLNKNGGYNLTYKKGKVDDITKPYFFEVENSLYADGILSGLSENALGNLEEALSDKFSFSRDLRIGDTISLMVDEKQYKGKRIGKQKITAVILNSQKKGEITAIKYTKENGESGFYDTNGKSIVSGFMRFPLKHYTRISSNFNPHRLHPVRKTPMPHTGTDIASPRGTPVYASSNGKVSFAKRNGGYGNVIYVEHPNGVQTRYAHLSRISVKKGQEVKKGEVIGRVGSTGMSTGSHLHFEYRINGVPQNAMKVNMPLADSLKGDDLVKFKSFRSNVIAALLNVDESKKIVKVEKNKNNQEITKKT